METRELTGALLDMWVANASGAAGFAEIRMAQRSTETICVIANDGTRAARFAPSTDWAQGGPIIERENIQIGPPTQSVHRNGGPNAGWGMSGVWSACTWHKGANGKRSIEHGEKSPLVAAMRCFVKSVYGDTVPDEVAP